LSTAFAVGASVVLLDYLLPQEVLLTLERERITGFAAVPPIWIQLADLPWPEGVRRTPRYIPNAGGLIPRAPLAQPPPAPVPGGVLAAEPRAGRRGDSVSARGAWPFGLEVTRTQPFPSLEWSYWGESAAALLSPAGLLLAPLAEAGIDTLVAIDRDGHGSSPPPPAKSPSPSYTHPPPLGERRELYKRNP